MAELLSLLRAGQKTAPEKGRPSEQESVNLAYAVRRSEVGLPWALQLSSAELYFTPGRDVTSELPGLLSAQAPPGGAEAQNPSGYPRPHITEKRGARLSHSMA